MVYEDIRVRTKKFAIQVIKQSKEFKLSKVDYPLIDQFLRSGTSIGANVKEGKASSTRKELIRYYDIALRSANEFEFWIEVIEEGYDIRNDKIVSMKKELEEISKVLGSIIIKLKK